MYPGNDPFGTPRGADPFGAPPPASNSGYAAPGWGMPDRMLSNPPHGGGSFPPPQQTGFNTYAILSPIFGVVVPPAGVALGHLALPQIRRTGERGRGVAIAGLVIGYLMCVVLVALLVWWLVSDSDDDGSTSSSTQTSMTKIAAPTSRPRPTTVTSTAPPVRPQRIKVELATVPIGTCVEIQRRSTESENALDLFKVDCERRTGVYTVANRVATIAQCNSVYVAAPPDGSLAVCLNPY